MHVLSIGSDRKLFEQNSAVAQRSVLYGKKIGHLCIIVFSLKSQKFEITKLSPEVTVYPTNSVSRFMYVFDAIRRAKEVVVTEKFVRGESVVTCQDPFESGLVGFRVARHFNFPLHLQVHTDFLSPYFKTSILQRIRVLLGKFLLSKADGVRVVSKRISDSFASHGIQLKHSAQVMPIVINVEEKVAPDLHPVQFPEFKFKIVMMSRLEKEKRIEDALTAFKTVLTEYPHTGLIIIGSGRQMASLKEYGDMIGVGQSVRFVGWSENPELLIKSADVFLSTSEYEGYGMSLIEAGLWGVPVITTDVGVAGEVLVDGQNSYICPVGDTICIKDRIIRLITHNEMRSVFSMTLREDIKKIMPSIEAYSDMYVQGLRDTLKNYRS